MILFYSDFCGHCRTIMEELTRRGASNEIKLASVDKMRALGMGMPKALTGVPALMVSNNEWLIGRQVFNFLFLPGRGLLNQGAAPSQNKQEEQKTQNEIMVVSDALQDGQPSPFTLGGEMSQDFGMLSETALDGFNTFHNAGWTNINEEQSVPTSTSTTIPQQELGSTNLSSEDTRVKKESLNLDSFRATRDKDLSQLLNGV